MFSTCSSAHSPMQATTNRSLNPNSLGTVICTIGGKALRKSAWILSGLVAGLRCINHNRTPGCRLAELDVADLLPVSSSVRLGSSQVTPYARRSSLIHEIHGGESRLIDSKPVSWHGGFKHAGS